MHRLLVLGVLIAFLQATSAATAEDLYPYRMPADGKDLTFPSAPQPFGYARANRMFKPDGAGPFPGLVVLPTCGGHQWHHAFDVWAKAALDRGYAVLVVDPLTPRGVVGKGENCRLPVKVGTARYLKDAFDAAEHLRKQPFVNPDRIGLLGLSLGAMASLGAAGESQDRRAFRGIVSIYPICFLANFMVPGRKQPMNVHYIPDKVAVPLQVQMGELDTEAPPSDCVPRLSSQKDKGSPVEFIVHKNATHNWDAVELGSSTFTKKGFFGQSIVYRYNPDATKLSVKQAFDFLDRHLRAE